ncbi:peptide/nickel transport system ATP-binding protein [Arboricoccus pini]|uniref:Peptide/nickel transport system ATP-binding protein n=1 Tax=Arboricoccus pini TaxID=1963835 RepID=A0A212R821_9PROT|nr:ABC transporter ATP-binding protein [Arboricoccus pini]SNB68314.1 peptide/nickel transport system ATP-binding protein [Arboricoccus pini]
MTSISPEAPLLEVEGLRVSFATQRGLVEAVRGVSFAMGREKLGIVGESGSGKSTIGRALMRLVPSPGVVTGQKLKVGGKDVLSANERDLQGLRGGKIAMIMQDPKFSLNPVMRIGTQIEEAIRMHRRVTRKAARAHAMEALLAVRISNPERVYHCFPHELSGGMGQRAMIAMMLSTQPDVLIADEPTSALDVTVQAQVLAILDDLVSRRGMGLIMISHDLELVASFCDRVLVMYAGRIVETLEASALSRAVHPYTRGLIACLPRLSEASSRLQTMQRDPAWSQV